MYLFIKNKYRFCKVNALVTIPVNATFPRSVHNPHSSELITKNLAAK